MSEPGPSEIERRLDQRIDYVEKSIAAALAASEKAILKAEASSNERAAAANEWRGAMDDVNRRLPTRTEIDARIDALIAKTDEIKERLDRTDGAFAGMRNLVILGGTVLGTLIAISTYLSIQTPTFPAIRDVQIEGTAQ